MGGADADEGVLYAGGVETGLPLVVSEGCVFGVFGKFNRRCGHCGRKLGS